MDVGLIIQLTAIVDCELSISIGFLGKIETGSHVFFINRRGFRFQSSKKFMDHRLIYGILDPPFVPIRTVSTPESFSYLPCFGIKLCLRLYIIKPQLNIHNMLNIHNQTSIISGNLSCLIPNMLIGMCIIKLN